ncbi:hypothetical protein DL98DRAFT_53775 [Cadophora sp. DSE1049]|nr:hypothetical protein DL98DRAFT_53775 [Cadophora sp. DSE1049]
MISIARTLRQKLPSNLKAASSFSQTEVKIPAANIHTVKLVQLHDNLHRTVEPELRFRGLQILQFPPCPASSLARIALHNQGRVTAEIPKFCFMAPPIAASMAGAAKQTISAMISASARVQINKI